VRPGLGSSNPFPVKPTAAPADGNPLAVSVLAGLPQEATVRRSSMLWNRRQGEAIARFVDCVIGRFLWSICYSCQYARSRSRHKRVTERLTDRPPGFLGSVFNHDRLGRATGAGGFRRGANGG